MKCIIKDGKCSQSNSIPGPNVSVAQVFYSYDTKADSIPVGRALRSRITELVEKAGYTLYTFASPKTPAQDFLCNICLEIQRDPPSLSQI